LRQPAGGIAYPEKHDRWEKNGRLGLGEDEVAGYFENDILRNQIYVSLDLDLIFQFRVSARYNLR
jgi:hypothetical protein